MGQGWHLWITKAFPFFVVLQMFWYVFGFLYTFSPPPIQKTIFINMDNVKRFFDKCPRIQGDGGLDYNVSDIFFSEEVIYVLCGQMLWCDRKLLLQIYFAKWEWFPLGALKLNWGCLENNDKYKSFKSCFCFLGVLISTHF